MPNAHLQQEVVNIPDGTVLLAEGYQDSAWPVPQLCTVRKGKVNLRNESNNPILSEFLVRGKQKFGVNFGL